MNKEIIGNIGNIIQTKILKFELPIILVIALLIIVNIWILPLPKELLFVVFTTIGMIYFFSGFAISVHDSHTGLTMFFNKLIAVSSSITLIGILFYMQNITGNAEMLLVGTITLLLSLVFILTLKRKDSAFINFTNALYIRIIVLLHFSIGIILESYT